MKKQAVISFSGGMDSSSLLLRLLANSYEVTAISFEYGQKHNIELEKAKGLVSFLQRKNIFVKHHVIEINGLSELLYSSLIKGGDDLVEGCYNKKNIKDTVVPNRNKIFSSIIQSVALSLVIKNKNEVVIGMGIHGGDHIIYPDCRQDFRDKDYKAFISGNWDEAEKVTYYLPYINESKTFVLKDGLSACVQLNLNYKDVYRQTHTSYNVIAHHGQKYSDYKSASSIERIIAFLNNKIKDPIEYADHCSPVSWSVASDYAHKTTNVNNKK